MSSLCPSPHSLARTLKPRMIVNLFWKESLAVFGQQSNYWTERNRVPRGRVTPLHFLQCPVTIINSNFDCPRCPGVTAKWQLSVYPTTSAAGCTMLPKNGRKKFGKINPKIHSAAQSSCRHYHAYWTVKMTINMNIYNTHPIDQVCTTAMASWVKKSWTAWGAGSCKFPTEEIWVLIFSILPLISPKMWDFQPQMLHL